MLAQVVGSFAWSSRCDVLRTCAVLFVLLFILNRVLDRTTKRQ